MQEEPLQVKCADCGSLAIRHRREGGLAEVDTGYRANGMPEMGTDAKRWPTCFVRAWPLREVVLARPYEENSALHSPDPLTVVKVLGHARNSTMLDVYGRAVPANLWTAVAAFQRAIHGD